MAKSLLEILPESNIELLPSSNGRWVAVCPFHDGDRDPSFTVYTHNDTYYCFGCGAWGDPVKFLCDYKGFTSKQAQEYLGIDYEYKRAEKDRVIKIRDTVRTWEFLHRVTALYHANLYTTSGAYNYLRDRGLSEQTIAQYSIGYTDGRVLSVEYATDFKIAHEAGLINNQGYEVLSHRIIVPNITGKNTVDFLMGRTVINDHIKYLGIRLPKPMYGFSKNSKSPILFMAEGQFDWLILEQWGYPAIIMSGSHLPRYHLMALREKTVVIVPDNDDTGMATAKKVHASLPNSIILDYSSLGVKDVGDLGMTENGEEMFNNLIKEQEWFKTIPLLRAHWMKWFPSSLGRQSLH